MVTSTVIQNSLSAGEFSPFLYGRQDLEKYHSGTSTCRNFFSNYQGGVSSRAGLAYVGMTKQQYPNPPPRDIPFQFSLTQGYVLEFGEEYMRVKTNGAYVTEAAKTVTSVSSVGVFTVTGHGFSTGDWVYDAGNVGFSGLTWIIIGTTTNTFTVSDLFGNVVTSATASTGGTVSRLFTLVTPYHAVDLPYLKYAQSADVMTLVLVNTGTQTEYPPYELVRLANDDWAITQEVFMASISAPTGLIAVAQASDVPTTWYSYVVTAVSDVTGEESVASLPVAVQNNDISLEAGSNLVTWSAVADATSYNVYASTPSYSTTVPASSLFGFIGTALGPSFTDTNIVADFTKVPPSHSDPFVIGAVTDILPTAGGVNYSQQTIGYSITTSTGSGFSGLPVVSNGMFAGFIIYNEGKNYRSTDTITLTDSGGGVAKGDFVGASNPVDGNSVIMNGVTIKFRRSSTAPAFDETPLGNTLALTLQSLSNFCNASTDISLSCAVYTYDATHLYITYKTPGSVGNAYTLDVDSSGFTKSGANLTGGGTAGTGATGGLTVGPLTGTFPSVVAYYQQRRVYGASLNDPDTYWMTRPGLYNNMDTSIPVTAADAIIGTPWAQQVNSLQALVPMPGGLVVLTGLGAWQVNGGSSAAITPSTQTATPQAYNGCHNHIPAIVVNYDILYVQAKGSIVRDLAYNFFTNIYTGTDLTILSNHLFQNFQINQWAYAQEPFKLVWAVRNDGTLLCLTYLKEQEVSAWTRHDTNGLFQGVCSVTEFPTRGSNPFTQPAGVDAVYTITQRYVQGGWRYYSERMDDRTWTNSEDAFCVDSGIRSSLMYPDAILQASAATGPGVTFIATSSVFNSGNVGDVIRVGGGTATVTSYVSGTEVIGTVTDTIVDTIPDDPNDIPAPAQSGDWSIATPFTTFSGLNHLNGLSVAILADGSIVDNQIVTNNSVTLDQPASLVTVGLPYTCQVQTLYLDAPGPEGTIQTKRKTISSVGVRVDATRGITVGADQPDQASLQNFASPPWTDMNEIKQRTPSVYAGNAIPLYTGDYYKNITSGWDVRGQIAIQQSYPLPANILAVVAYFATGDGT